MKLRTLSPKSLGYAALLTLLASPAAWAASLTFDNAATANEVAISAGQFEGGFSVNGAVIQTPGLGSGATTVAETANSCVITYTGSWIELDEASLFSRTVYFVEPADTAVVTDILVIDYTDGGSGAIISGTWTSDACGSLGAIPGGTDPADIIPADGSTQVGFSNAYLGARAFAATYADMDASAMIVTDPVLAGAPMTATVGIENLGPHAAPGTSLSLTVPAGMTYVSDTGGCTSPGVGVHDCATGDLAPGGTASVDFVFDVAVDATDSTLSVTASSTLFDPDTANDVANEPITITQASSLTSTFATSIVFTNGDTGTVSAMLTCNAGLPLAQSYDIAEGSPVTFTMTELPFTTPGTECEIALDGVDTAYTTSAVANGGTAAATCMFDSTNLAVDGMNSCVFTAMPMPVAVEVNTDVIGVDSPSIDTSFETTVTCTNVSPDTGPTFGTAMATDTTGTFMADWYAKPGATASCTAVMVPTDSAVEGDECSFSFELGDTTAGCDLEGTVFFEGIPTLSQYGKAIMALLMLGIGFVGFRRFV